MEKYEKICEYCSAMLIYNDCETIKTLMQKVKAPVFSMEVLPFYALFCRAFQEYCGVDFMKGNISSEIYDIRNSIKVYSKRYGQVKKEFLNVDENQNNHFRQNLRFDFSKELNIHYNLGIYFDEGGNIVGNTQLIAEMLSVENVFDKSVGIRMFELSNAMSSIIMTISQKLNASISPLKIEIKDDVIKWRYMDINTNTELFFFKNEYEKDVNLYMLHIISNIGFVKYILSRKLTKSNLWFFRVQYIITYYSYMGMKKLCNHLEETRGDSVFVLEMKNIINEGKDLFLSKFRNCMMHYGVENKSDMIIKEEYFDREKPLFGIIESCFKGMDFCRYQNKLLKIMDDIEHTLLQNFGIDGKQLKKF